METVGDEGLVQIPDFESSPGVEYAYIESCLESLAGGYRRREEERRGAVAPVKP
jgi:hypothetical protein